MNAATDHYQTLGVSREATREEIKAAYRKRAAECHPDQNSTDGEEMARLNVAYETLSDPDKRRIYDQTGLQQPPGLPDQARQLVAQLILQWIQNDAFSSLQLTVKAQLNTELQAATENVREGERVVHKTRQGLARLRFTGRGDDFARRAVETRIQQLETMIDAARLNVERVRLALEYVADYDSTMIPTSAPSAPHLTLFPRLID